LDVVPIELPPLRDRVEDIEPLARHFLHQFTETLRKPLRELAPESIALLTSYPWPGNVRELKNVLERTVILEDAEVLLPRHLPELIQRRTPATSDRINPFTLPETGIDLDRLEEDLIRQALERTKGVKSAAARLLGLSRDTLRYRIEKYGLERRDLPES
jgi:DNA-binding NtrC family response regulator